MRFTRFSSLTALILFTLSSANPRMTQAQGPHPVCPRPWLFFDLGNTLVDTKTYNAKPILYMRGAFDYLMDLKRKGYRISVMANFPDEWEGKNRKGNVPEKVKAIKFMIKRDWAPKRIEPNPMVWAFFDEIHVPPTDAESKPARYLYDLAVSRAAAYGCRAVFQGETLAEVQAAHQFGMVARQVGQPRLPFYFPEEQLRTIGPIPLRWRPVR